ncbi:MAG: KTSC domain-containing protein [Chthoniobacteraceae bacterium]
MLTPRFAFRKAALCLAGTLLLATSPAHAQSGLIERKAVKSSDLASVGYDQKSRVLEIEFHSGGIYRYHEVPREIFDRLLAAESKGRFFAGQIRHRFRFERIKPRASAAK